MACSGSHLKALFTVLEKMKAGVVAHRQVQETDPKKPDRVLNTAIDHLQDEHAQAKRAVADCPECSTEWAALQP